MNFKKSHLVHASRPLSGYSLDTIEREIETLFDELYSTIELKKGDFRQMSAFDLDVIIAVIEAQKARRNDSAFILTIFSSLIALSTVATTDLIESWTISHLLTFVFIWIVLLMLVERFFDHRNERLVLLGEYLALYKEYKFSKDI